MMTEHEFERLLQGALGGASRPAPFSVDVADHVMARVAELGTSNLVRWAIAASVAGGALVAAAVWNGPSLEQIASSLGHTLAGTTGATIKLFAPAGAIAGSLGRVGSALLGSIQTLASWLTPFQPLARLMLGTCAAVILAITSFVVLRDFTTGIAHKEPS